MSEGNRQHRDKSKEDGPEAVRYTATGHPSVQQLMATQGTGPIADIACLHGDFWPREESMEEFLETLREWRGHKGTEPAA